MYGLFQTTFYFGYMALFSMSLGLMCATLGYMGTSLFVRKIYSTVKIDWKNSQNWLKKTVKIDWKNSQNWLKTKQKICWHIILMTFRGVFLGYAATRDAVLPLKKIVFVVRSKKKPNALLSITLHTTIIITYTIICFFLLWVVQ